MKKKISILMMVCVMCISAILFTACGGDKFASNPAADDLVSSNGGSVVQKGDFLYYMNGFSSSTEMTGEKANEEGSVTHAALYRTELVNGEIAYDDDGYAKNVELIVSLNVGVESSQIYIFGEKIYFASPTTKKDKTGTVRYDLRTFYSADLDGENLEVVHETNEWNTEMAEFNMVSIGGKVYLTVFDGNTLKEVEIKNGEEVKTTTIAEGVTSVAFDEVDTDRDITSESLKEVYYTRNFTEDESRVAGNVLAKFNRVEAKEVILVSDNKTTFEVIEKYDEIVFYSKSDDVLVATIHFAKNTKTNEEVRLTDTAYTEVLPVYYDETSESKGVIAFNENVQWVKSPNEIELVVSGSYTPLKMVGNIVYAYDSANVLVAIDYVNKEVKILSDSVDTLKTDSKVVFDYAGRYVYVFRTFAGESESDVYLARIDASREEVGEFAQVGNVETEHMPVPEEEPESENNGDRPIS